MSRVSHVVLMREWFGLPVEFQKWITRADLQANPHKLYLFGDNDLRRGLKGQAKEMRGEPNAVGIRTKRLPSMSDVSFYDDDHLQENCDKIFEDFKLIFDWVKAGGTVVIPEDGLGTGLASLTKYAPITAEYIRQTVIALNETMEEDDRLSYRIVQ